MADAARRLMQNLVTRGPKLALGNCLEARPPARSLAHSLTHLDALRNTLVVTEIVMWFYIGEVIGRRSLIGYKV
ncbi:ATP synthase subunit g, mitochondrial-like [Rhincodon typus]|uniref:ATP synthase subunit g, mitochondrial-like n=1 Tax=Rhincodon typus TaxID=259920 RepID=UPI0020308868|nr:ATP synthase subunit g, mitochondrial-like [Rhincodon typus]